MIGRLFKSLFGSDKAWWVEIKTQNPTCTYYFGPFSIAEEAELAKGGYIQDLEQEGAAHIQTAIKHCEQPQQLTISEEESDTIGGIPSPVFSQS